ncbi:SDR family NAD(P)-dependent oxidoreductase [Actinokineospora iranica]|uniref:NADP-dependent 3-hydroxy acid dehydrogenase YdfG n=1 Tax=Actinokineospora iranica TaxID=1271860 RepID=A0A1G6IPQ8_9PSEU|nr:SDR family oxidoreductase [Actinokineospora iranica]SDC07746.1 NADP-dependent 3-hydroxy acid dehydrogenase YdfG [Actinokineospora iranica]
MAADPSRVAVVSGASSGIGAAVAAEFSHRGYTVVGLSRRGNPALARTEGYVDLVADLCDEEAVRAALTSASETLAGGVKAVVLNAGASPEPTDLVKAEWRVAAQAYETNVRTALTLVQAMAPLLKQSGGGSLTFVGASLANGYEPKRWAYAASKAAMTTLMRACSVEFADDGVVANEVRPGPVATAMTMPGIDGEVSDALIQAVNAGFGTDWLKSSRTVAQWIATIAEFPSNGPTGQVFNYSRKVL